MPKFYFTYGSDERFPFQYGWTEIEAPSRVLACDIFREYHPNPNSEDPYPNREPELDDTPESGEEPVDENAAPDTNAPQAQEDGHECVHPV